MPISRQILMAAALAVTITTAAPLAQAQSHYDQLANLPFKEGYITKDNEPTLLNDLFFQRAVQTYLWALPGAQYVWHEGRLGEGLRQRL